MLPKLTTRQMQVLDVIQSRVDEIGAPPTQAEIASALGFSSKNAARDHLLALEKKGYIKIHGDKNRAIQIVAPREDELPLIGQVAAGQPIEAIENVERLIPVPRNLFKSQPTFLLRVRGDSMKNVGIIDGDIIAVKKTEVAEMGQIVIARVNDDVTVKRLAEQDGMVCLLPENDDYQPIVVPPSELFIEGLFVGLIRDAG